MWHLPIVSTSMCAWRYGYDRLFLQSASWTCYVTLSENLVDSARLASTYVRSFHSSSSHFLATPHSNLSTGGPFAAWCEATVLSSSRLMHFYCNCRQYKVFQNLPLSIFSTMYYEYIIGAGYPGKGQRE